MNLNQDKQFLKEIISEIRGLNERDEEIFYKRFRRENEGYINAKLAVQVTRSNGVDQLQNFTDRLKAIAKKFEARYRNEPFFPKILQGRGRGAPKAGTEDWRLIYKWLWEIKFETWKSNLQKISEKEEKSSLSLNNEEDKNEYLILSINQDLRRTYFLVPDGNELDGLRNRYNDATRNLSYALFRLEFDASCKSRIKIKDAKLFVFHSHYNCRGWITTVNAHEVSPSNLPITSLEISRFARFHKSFDPMTVEMDSTIVIPKCSFSKWSLENGSEGQILVVVVFQLNNMFLSVLCKISKGIYNPKPVILSYSLNDEFDENILEVWTDKFNDEYEALFNLDKSNGKRTIQIPVKNIFGIKNISWTDSSSKLNSDQQLNEVSTVNDGTH
jgi:hypothetical protein